MVISSRPDDCAVTSAVPLSTEVSSVVAIPFIAAFVPGFMEVPPNSGNCVLMDVHGAGAQRSDPKQGDPENYPHGFGPQGDVIRIYNFVRLVRNDSPNSIENEETELPGNFRLEQNYPNPFNPTTKIRYVIPNEVRNLKDFSSQAPRNDNSLVTLKVYDILGNEVVTLVNEEKSAGSYEVTFNATDFSSGIYFYKIETDNFVETKKMILMK